MSKISANATANISATDSRTANSLYVFNADFLVIDYIDSIFMTLFSSFNSKISFGLVNKM